MFLQLFPEFERNLTFVQSCMTADEEYHPDISKNALTETELSFNPSLAFITENNRNRVQLVDCALLAYHAVSSGNF